MSGGPNALSAVRAAALIRSGEVRPSEVMSACLAQISRRDSEVGAFVCLDGDRAMRRALHADESPSSGPLHGIPFAIKDIIDTRELPTGWGSAIYEGRQPTRDASCVDAFVKAGAIPVGKTVTTEFACFQPGKTANPHNLRHTPGGSSSGSAAAVADLMVPLAFGSQTAASLIRPASYCGICAYKSTTGALELDGVMALSPSLDSLGMLARDVADLMLARTVLSGSAVPDGNHFGNELPRVSLMRGPHWNEASPETRNACMRTMNALSDAGAETGEAGSDGVFDALTDAHKIVMAYEAFRTRRREYDHHQSELSAQFLALVEGGAKVSDKEYAQALSARDKAKTVLDQLFETSDILLAPSAPGEAPRGLHATGDPIFSRMWSLLQVPCVAIPSGFGPSGLPVGVQMIGARHRDDGLLQACARIESVIREQG